MKKWNTRVWSSQHISKRRRDVARGTTCLGHKERLATSCRSLIKAAGRRRRRCQTQLITKQLWQLGSNQIRFLRDGDAETRIRKAAMTVHLKYGDVVVPV